MNMKYDTEMRLGPQVTIDLASHPIPPFLVCPLRPCLLAFVLSLLSATAPFLLDLPTYYCTIFRIPPFFFLFLCVLLLSLLLFPQLLPSPFSSLIPLLIHIHINFTLSLSLSLSSFA
jgi:hypothetical protein